MKESGNKIKPKKKKESKEGCESKDSSLNFT